MNIQSIIIEDIFVWPDGTWCYRYEAPQYQHMSDDYIVVPREGAMNNFENMTKQIIERIDLLASRRAGATLMTFYQTDDFNIQVFEVPWNLWVMLTDKPKYVQEYIKSRIDRPQTS